MLQGLIVGFAFNTELNAICSLHDAIYIYCPEDQMAEEYAIFDEAMSRAVASIVGSQENNWHQQTIIYHSGRLVDKSSSVMETTIDTSFSDIYTICTPSDLSIKIWNEL